MDPVLGPIPWDGSTSGGGGSGGGPILDGVSATIKATVKDFTNSNPLTVVLVDNAGTVISTLPVSAASLPLPLGASTEATLALIKAKTDNIDVALSTRTKPADAQHTIIDSSASIAVTGPLTDTQLRATAVPISAASLPLPSDAATQTTLALIKSKTDNIDVALSTRTKPADQQHVIIDSSVTTAGTVALSNVVSSATNVTLLAANSSRKMVVMFNDSTQAAYVKFGAAASATSFTYKVFPSQTLTFDLPIYQGIVDALWDSANGNMRITEIT